MYVGVCVCVRLCVCACAHVCVCASAFVCACARVCMCVQVGYVKETCGRTPLLLRAALYTIKRMFALPHYSCMRLPELILINHFPCSKKSITTLPQALSPKTAIRLERGLCNPLAENTHPYHTRGHSCWLVSDVSA